MLICAFTIGPSGPVKLAAPKSSSDAKPAAKTATKAAPKKKKTATASTTKTATKKAPAKKAATAKPATKKAPATKTKSKANTSKVRKTPATVRYRSSRTMLYNIPLTLAAGTRCR